MKFNQLIVLSLIKFPKIAVIAYYLDNQFLNT